MGDVQAFRHKDLQQSFSPRGSSVHELVNDRNGAKFACGVSYFKDAEIDFTLWYDEVMICFEAADGFEIEVDGKAHALGPGDSIWLPAGTRLIYRSKGTAGCYYVVTPVDWQAHKPT